jgi:hypothetical protein
VPRCVHDTFLIFGGCPFSSMYNHISRFVSMMRWFTLLTSCSYETIYVVSRPFRAATNYWQATVKSWNYWLHESADYVCQVSAIETRIMWCFHRCRPDIGGMWKRKTPDLKDKTGWILTSDTDKANILNEHFTSVFTNEPLNINVPTPLAYDGEKISDLYITIDKQ